VKPQPKANPVYYIDGKRAENQDPQKLVDVNLISHIEVISNPQVLTQQGEQADVSIINVITKENAKNKEAYIATESKRTIEEVSEERRLVNTLTMGVLNPIQIFVDGTTPDNVVVTMKGGTITKQNGKYFAQPTQTGNVEIYIYKKEGEELKLINKRVFRVAPARDL
jgi:hypothetical protein